MHDHNNTSAHHDFNQVLDARLSRRSLLLSGLALGLAGRAAFAQSYSNEGDPFGGSMEAGPGNGGGESDERSVWRRIPA